MKRKSKNNNQRVIKDKFVEERQNRVPVIHPKTQNQKKFMDALRKDKLIIAKGSAGTGKTLIACWYAAELLSWHKIKKIVLMRAYQPLAGRSTGFRPGTYEEKLFSFYTQLLEYLEEFLGKGTVEVAIRNKEIELGDLEAVRGKSWDNGTLIICDESQNLFVPEIQALTTRLGEDSQIVFLGDDSGFQTDVRKGVNGLDYLTNIVTKYKIPDVGIISFTEEDIVRSGMTKDFVKAYAKEENDE